MAVRGDDPLKIKQHGGHKAFATTEVGESVRAGFRDPFRPLPACFMGRGASPAPARCGAGGIVNEASVTIAGSRQREKQALLAERAGFEPAAGCPAPA